MIQGLLFRVYSATRLIELSLFFKDFSNLTWCPDNIPTVFILVDSKIYCFKVISHQILVGISTL